MKLALGTAQFGLDYGVSNTAGQTPIDEVRRILYLAKVAIDTLDTAAAYGDSEDVLGEIGITDWHVITKIPPLPNNTQDGEEWVLKHILQSLDKLRIGQLEGVLLHDAHDLLKAQGGSILNALQEAKSNGLVKKIGYSIYSPNQLDELVAIMRPDLVQAPFNVFDQRLKKTGWLDRLTHLGTEVHVRSVFMQGLLLMVSEKRPHLFDKWSELWRRWDVAVKEGGNSAQALCLGFIKNYPNISSVVVGVENAIHLEQLLMIWDKSVSFDATEFSCNDVDLLEPTNWKPKLL